MLKIDAETKTLTKVAPTSLRQSNVLERDHLQAAIIGSWDAFCSELGQEELYLLGQEITPHDSCRDRIDILAMDGDGHPVVFELKRHRDKMQLLQAVSYAAMLSKWGADQYLSLASRIAGEPGDELRALLRDDSVEIGAPRIILLAETYDPEVILTADWLAGFGVDISAFAVSALDHNEETLISIDQRFPLLAVDDLYVGRRTRPVRTGRDDLAWNDVVGELNFAFAGRAIEVFRRHKEGHPGRRCFFSIYSESPLGRMRINLRKNYIKIYTRDQSPEAEETLRSRLGAGIEIITWGSEKTRNSGFTFQLTTEEQFDSFLKAVGEEVS